MLKRSSMMLVISLLVIMVMGLSLSVGAVENVVKLKLAMWTDDIPNTEEVIDKFEAENPGIEVEIIEFPAKEYDTALAVQLAGGAEIDMFAMKNNAQYADLAAKGQTLSLESYIKEDKINLSGFGPLLEGLRFKGEVQALPYRTTTWVLYYNKDLFDDMGVEYPSGDMTWAEFRQLARKMTKGEGNNKQWGAYVHTWEICSFGPALQTGATLIDEDLSPFKEALQLRLDLENDGSIMSYVDQIATSAHYKSAFFKGNVAMNVIGDWHINHLRVGGEEGTIDFDWDIVPLPHPEGVSSNTTWGMPTTMAISSRSKKKDAAWEFLKYMTGPEGAKVTAAAGKLPGFTNEEIKNIYLGDGSKKPDNLGIVLDQKVYVEYPAIPGINIIVKTIYKEESELVFAGEQSPVEAVENIKQRIKEEL